MSTNKRDTKDVERQAATTRNTRTVAAYEGYAETYAAIVGTEPFSESANAMRRLAAVLPRPCQVLEVGSGTGYDADFLEELGISVRRTDATGAFVAMQRDRGKAAARLNVISDSLGGPYDAVQALCVFIHLDRVAMPDVLRKIHDALHPRGRLLVSMREGEGTQTSGDWHTVLWRNDDLEALYADGGFSVEWHSFHEGGDDERWNTHLLRRV